MVRDEKGQSIIEFIAFVPFILIFFSIFTNISGAINGAINQQKITRGYYYAIDKGNSFFPSASHMKRPQINSFSIVEYFAVGWKEKFQNDKPIATCYKMINFMGAEPADDCENATKLNQGRTQFVRPYTAYGACGVTYAKDGTVFRDSWRSSGASCSTRN